MRAFESVVRALRSGAVVLASLSSVPAAQAGIISLAYAETQETFSLRIAGDAIDADTTSSFSFGSSWQIDLTIQEIDAPNDQLVISGTATHLVPAPGEEIGVGISVLGSDKGVPVLGIAFPPHNPAGVFGFGPFDSYSFFLSYFSTSQLGLPPPGTLPDQITQWSFTLNGTHISEPDTRPILLTALLGLWYLQRRRTGRR